MSNLTELTTRPPKPPPPPSGPRGWEDWKTYVGLLQISVSSIGTLTNLLIIVLYIMYRSLRQLNGFHLMLLLAIGDFLTCLGDTLSIALTIPDRMFNARDFFPKMTTMSCLFYISPGIVGQQWSILIACVIAIDRIRAIKSPLVYRNENHQRTAAIICAIVAVYSVCGTVGAAISLQIDLTVICTHSSSLQLLKYCS
jgi:hypothetical protein